MATDKPRFSITVDEELFQTINDYQHRHKLSTQTKAVVALLEKGVESLRQPSESTPTVSKGGKPAFILNEEECKLVSKYRLLSPCGRDMVSDFVSLMVTSYSDVSIYSEKYNTAAARSGDRVKVNHVSPEEEDAALPPDFSGGDV